VTIEWRTTAPAERAAGALLGGAVLALGLATVTAVLGIGVPPTDDGGVVAVGLVLTTAGTALAVYAQLVMGASWRIGMDAVTPTNLVTTGPFRLVRNPIYTAMVCFVAGITVLLRSPASVVALILLISGLEVQVRRVEEPFLASRHGWRYLAWARSTGRFVPQLGRRTRVDVRIGRYRGSSETAPATSHREAPRSGQGGG
jgi:protein-S-isoprenylcysteine O-methyltransferase Ste14